MTTVKQIAETFGLTMIDANKSLDVTITKADIAGAKAHNQSECAVARAVCRQYGAKNSYVLLSTVWVDDGEHLTRYTLPSSLQKEIVSFDRSKDFRPGNYHLAPSRARAQFPVDPKIRAKRKTGKKPIKRVKPQHKKHMTDGVRLRDLDPVVVRKKK